jgi:hypothetical protein
VVKKHERVENKTPTSCCSVKKGVVAKPPVFLQCEYSAQERENVSRRSVTKIPLVKPLSGFLQRVGHQNVHDKVLATNTDKTPLVTFARSKCIEPKDNKVSAAWDHHQALSASRNKDANKYKVLSAIFTNQYIVPDDAVSRLYYDPDVDDEDAFPPATIAVFENCFDGIDIDLEETDDESSFSSSASVQGSTYSKTVPSDYPPSYLHFDLDPLTLPC